MSLSLLPILCKLDQTHGNSKFLEIKTGSRGCVGNRPNVFQNLDWKLGAPKEFDRIGSTDVSPSLYVGSFEESQIVGLLMLKMKE